MSDVQIRDGIDAGPQWWLGKSGRWEYRLVKRFGDDHAEARRLSDNATLNANDRCEFRPDSPAVAFRRLRRMIRRLERQEAKMP